MSARPTIRLARGEQFRQPEETLSGGAVHHGDVMSDLTHQIARPSSQTSVRRSSMDGPLAGAMGTQGFVLGSQAVPLARRRNESVVAKPG